ncbi:ABC transporter ATP-binding protein [Mycoavidus sp. B2-EB]|uniref:ABC transporter ATP-binding protein n=1 Tax=Mycoavidus sp. B2-EB TaxID=2651972 RepID=UPI00162A87A6|nr:ABC transporter ATP-binding protein [Mycoavidus sp. B2-EB]BBO59432.1 polyamine-transporting ATPase [Mycoavidus sp. B2-EB]
MSEPSKLLQTHQLGKQYGTVIALAPTDLVVSEGEFLTLLGPSGSGKTTLLSLIAGLLQPDEGRIHIGGVDVTHNPPYERDIGVVFQNYALFPHMTVAENIAFPLKMRKLGAREIKHSVAHVLELVELPHVAHRFPRELSGGQQQRIALARCMVYRPSIILMDEPLGALDKKLRNQMQLEIKRIHRELGTTILYVTHDQEEAMTMSDRICLMNGGQIEQLGTPIELYFCPQTAFVADFIGESNLLPARVEQVDGTTVLFTLNGMPGIGIATSNGKPIAPGSHIDVMIRPQHFQVSTNHDLNQNRIQATLTDFVVTGATSKSYLSAQGGTQLVIAELTQGHCSPRQHGEPLTLTWNAADAVAIPQESQRIDIK